MADLSYPLLYQINTRVWLTELTRALGGLQPWTIFRTPSWTAWPSMGFDWVWFLSVWQTGPAAQRVSRSDAGWRKEFEETLPDLREEDIAGSGFAITGYMVHRDLWAAQRRSPICDSGLQKRGLQADARLRPQPHGARITPGSSEHPGLLRPWHRDWIWLAHHRTTTWVQTKSGGDGARLRSRPVLRRLARHAPAQLRQSGHAGGDDRRAAEDRRAV